MNSPEVKRQTARLFVALEYGEQLASNCARQQSQLLAGNKQHRRFLLTQAKQEKFHAHFFRRAIQHLDAGETYSVPRTLKRFSSQLQLAIHKKDIIESLVGQQIVLESFGAAILGRLNTGMDRQGIGLQRLRHAIFAQEQSHQDFGETVLQQKLHSGQTTRSHLHSLGSKYLLLAEAIIDEMCDVFYYLDEVPGDYLVSLQNNLPCWLKETAA